MSIIIHIPRVSNDRSIYNPDNLDETVQDDDSPERINLPHRRDIKPNDLSKLEVSKASSKYTLSGDDMISNISLDSNLYYNGRKSLIEVENTFGAESLEKEIVIDSRGSISRSTKFGSPRKGDIHMPPKKEAVCDYNFDNVSEGTIYDEINKVDQNSSESKG
jgi:hypothetical protein